MVAGSLARYRPYGSYRTTPTQTLTDRDFTGQRENREFGLLYYQARYYLPGVGRFISADTIVPNPANPQSYNRYTYVENRPINLIDPSGHCASTELPDGSFARSADDADCWEQYDSLVARFTKAGHSAQWILNRIGSGAGYKFKDMGIVRVQDTYVNCGRDFDCSKRSEGSRRKNQYYQEQSCQPWDDCYTPVFDGDWGVELGTPIGAYEFNTGGNSINFGTDAGGCMPGAWVCGGAGPESQISTDSWETSTGVNLFAGLGVGGEVGNIGVGIWGGTEVTTISNQPELTVSYSNLIHAEFAGFSIELNYTPSEFR
ncbi:MAG: RHS repeat-associated core domain-containing protein [Ardenticatenaceae bacterium]|nr:RHS repeat-associated core domain-containing protein [Ardenticatenaceae bacterium]